MAAWQSKRGGCVGARGVWERGACGSAGQRRGNKGARRERPALPARTPPRGRLGKYMYAPRRCTVDKQDCHLLCRAVRMRRKHKFQRKKEKQQYHWD